MNLTPEQEKFLNKYTKGTWSINPLTGLVDIDGDFDCSYGDLEDFKGVQFGDVSGDFWCDNNRLMSLEGAPKEVRRNFGCYRNNLTTLEGAPETIDGGFYFNSRVQLQEGGWSIQSHIDLYETLDEKDKTLVGTLLTPEALQKRIDKNPEAAAVQLKGILHLPQYKSLKWPDRLKSEVDLLSSLDGIGL